MRLISSTLFTLTLAILFGLAVCLAFIALTFRDADQLLPLVIVGIAGLGLILHVWHMTSEGDSGGIVVATKDTHMATFENPYPARAERHSHLPWMTIGFVIVALLITAAFSFPDEFLSMVQRL